MSLGIQIRNFILKDASVNKGQKSLDLEYVLYYLFCYTFCVIIMSFLYCSYGISYWFP
jgi:hypothetical protein